jgi:hypothetical protein
MKPGGISGGVSSSQELQVGHGMPRAPQLHRRVCPARACQGAPRTPKLALTLRTGALSHLVMGKPQTRGDGFGVSLPSRREVAGGVFATALVDALRRNWFLSAHRSSICCVICRFDPAAPLHDTISAATETTRTRKPATVIPAKNRSVTSIGVLPSWKVGPSAARS